MRGILADYFLPMSAPAALYRCACAEGDSCGEEHDPVASGPLIIMVHGLMALPPERRDAFKISGTFGELTAADAAEAIRQWSQPAARDH